MFPGTVNLVSSMDTADWPTHLLEGDFIEQDEIWRRRHGYQDSIDMWQPKRQFKRWQAAAIKKPLFRNWNISTAKNTSRLN